MAAVKTDKPLDVTLMESPAVAGVGAYSPAANANQDLAMALDKPPASKINGSLDFADANKRWLKDLGLTTTDPRSFHRSWETSFEKEARAHRKWNETYQGRVAIRAISRGIVGAAFYAGANMYAGRAMAKYNNNVNDEEFGLVATKAKGVLPTVARIIDKTFGRAIQWTVKGHHRQRGKGD